MAKKKNKTISKNKTPRKKISFTLSKQQQILLGSFLFLLGLALLISFISFFFTWQADQSIVGELDRELEAKNWLSKFGSNIGHFFVYNGVGVAAFIFAFLVTLTGAYYFFNYAKKQLLKFWFWGLLLMLWFSVFFGFFTKGESLWSGVVGYELNDLFQDYMGLTGTILLMTFLAIIYLVVRLKMTPEKVAASLKSTKKQIAEDFISEENNTLETTQDTSTDDRLNDTSKENEDILPEPEIIQKEETPPLDIIKREPSEDDVEMEIEQVEEEETVEENLSKKLVEVILNFLLLNY